MTQVPTPPCGCTLEVHAPSGILHSVSKCDKHRAKMIRPEDLDAAYYERCGVLRDGFLIPTNHVAELTEALGPIPPATGDGYALEVGCGVSPYVAAIRRAGWSYAGIEPSAWAAGWMGNHLRAAIFRCRFEDFPGRPDAFGLILAAHVLEHTDDAPAALAKMAILLAPGGELRIIVPDDSDPVNPDHVFFFDPFTLRAAVESTGLVVEALESRRIVAHESFLYLKARKP
jgi:SAM-dependent methyltransferase